MSETATKPKSGRWQSVVVCPWCRAVYREWEYTVDVETRCEVCGQRYIVRTKQVFATEKVEAKQ